MVVARACLSVDEVARFIESRGFYGSRPSRDSRGEVRVVPASHRGGDPCGTLVEPARIVVG
jgi:hypothetical protein